MRALLLVFVVIFSACMDESITDSNSEPEITDEIINEVNNEQVVVYEILKDDRIISLEKNTVTDNITLSFMNPRNEDVYILIPQTEDNVNNYLSFFIPNNQEYICKAESQCELTFNMILGEQSVITGSFSFYLPVTLLNGTEFAKFILINQHEKYKETAMKYITHRVYIKYLFNALVVSQSL